MLSISALSAEVEKEPPAFSLELGDYFHSHANADAFTFAHNHKKQLSTFFKKNNNNKKELQK